MRADRSFRRPRRLLAVLAALAVLACAPAAVVRPEPQPERELVVLVHGLGRTRWSMLPLGRTLEAAGYRVVNWGYGSTGQTIPELGERLAVEVDRLASEAPERPIHFVGHSLGNILVRWALAHHPPPRVGRVVMLAPPNQGAAVADRMHPWLGWLLRPLAGLTTGELGVARTLAAPSGVEVGIIAGGRDGKVSVAETHLEGAQAHVVVPAYHTFIMARRDVRELVLRFLADGSFGEEVER